MTNKINIIAQRYCRNQIFVVAWKIRIRIHRNYCFTNIFWRARVCWPLLVFLRDVWILTRRAAVASSRATNLFTISHNCSTNYYGSGPWKPKIYGSYRYGSWKPRTLVICMRTVGSRPGWECSSGRRDRALPSAVPPCFHIPTAFSPENTILF